MATLAMCIFWLAEQLGGEPLLACVLAGIVLTNRKGEVKSPNPSFLHVGTDSSLLHTRTAHAGFWGQSVSVHVLAASCTALIAAAKGIPVSETPMLSTASVLRADMLCMAPGGQPGEP